MRLYSVVTPRSSPVSLECNCNVRLAPPCILIFCSAKFNSSRSSSAQVFDVFCGLGSILSSFVGCVYRGPDYQAFFLFQFPWTVPFWCALSLRLHSSFSKLIHAMLFADLHSFALRSLHWFSIATNVLKHAHMRNYSTIAKLWIANRYGMASSLDEDGVECCLASIHGKKSKR